MGKVAPRRRGASKEAGESGSVTADEAPHYTEQQQRQDRATTPYMPVHVIELLRPPGKENQDHDCPMEQPHGQVPYFDWPHTPVPPYRTAPCPASSLLRQAHGYASLRSDKPEADDAR